MTCPRPREVRGIARRSAREGSPPWECKEAGKQDVREVMSVAMSARAQGRSLSAVTNEMVTIAMDKWRCRDRSCEIRSSSSCGPQGSGQATSSSSGSSDSAELDRSPASCRKRKAAAEVKTLDDSQAKHRRV